MKTKSAFLTLLLSLSCLTNANASVIWGVNGHEYEVVRSEGITWEAARAAAQSLGPGWDLVTIGLENENTFVENLLGTANLADRSHFWMGATDTAIEGTWVWVDGTPVTFSDWWAGEPNDVFSSEDFLAYDLRGAAWAWNDAPAVLPPVYPRGYVAERVAPQAVPEPTSIALIGLGLLGLAAARRKARRKVMR